MHVISSSASSGSRDPQTDCFGKLVHGSGRVVRGFQVYMLATLHGVRVLGFKCSVVGIARFAIARSFPDITAMSMPGFSGRDKHATSALGWELPVMSPYNRYSNLIAHDFRWVCEAIHEVLVSLRGRPSTSALSA